MAELKQVSKPEIERTLEDAVGYLSPKFGVDKSYESPRLVIISLSKDTFAAYNDSHNVVKFDLEQFSLVTREHPFGREVLDLIAGEEIGHAMHHSIHPEVYKHVLPEASRTLSFVSEFIGHYSGLCYSNRDDDSKIFGLGAEGPGILGEAWKTADKVFSKYRDSRLENLARIKGATNTYREIKKLLGEAA